MLEFVFELIQNIEGKTPLFSPFPIKSLNLYHTISTFNDPEKENF